MNLRLYKQSCNTKSQIARAAILVSSEDSFPGHVQLSLNECLFEKLISLRLEFTFEMLVA